MQPQQQRTVQQRWQPLTHRQICSNLLLQQLLYYNAFLSAAWFAAYAVRIFLKYGSSTSLVADPDIIRTVLTVFWMLAEPVRLMAGYYGNLEENVPWLVIFAVMCLAPQAAVTFYLMLATYDISAFDKALQVVMAAFVLAELLVTAFAVTSMFRKQKRQFYLYEYALQRQRQQAAS